MMDPAYQKKNERKKKERKKRRRKKERKERKQVVKQNLYMNVSTSTSHNSRKWKQPKCP